MKKPPMKPELDMTREEYFSKLSKKSSDDTGLPTPEETHKSAPADDMMQALDIPEITDLGNKMEKEFETLRGKPTTHFKKLLNYLEKTNELLKPYIPCKKGCAYCCFIPVLVTGFEVALIEEYLDKNKITGYRKAARKKDGRIFIDKDDITDHSGRKCPFLKNNECAIYPARPYYCRKFMSFEKDNKNCASSADEIFMFSSLAIDKSYYNILEYFLATAKANPAYNAVHGDIRDFFY
jgi:Fe-S-cluster containining protein